MDHLTVVTGPTVEHEQGPAHAQLLVIEGYPSNVTFHATLLRRITLLRALSDTSLPHRHARGEVAGVVGVGASQQREFVCQALGGSVDWWDRRRLMVMVSFIQAAALVPVVLMRSEAWIWLLWLVGFIETSAAMFFQPAERALLPRLVAADQLVPANALTALNDNIARLVGPPVGGALLGFVGLGSIAALDSASFLLAGTLIAGHVPYSG